MKLKSNKAPGVDGITTECFKYGGKVVIKCLFYRFNLLKDVEYVPKKFKVGIIIPVPKREKNLHLKDSYRGITLLPVIAKIYEKCLIRRLETWSKNNNIISNQQGASISNCSSMHVALFVQEVISKYRDKGNNVFICMMDTKKAYDTVWLKGLFYQLYKTGVCCKAWRIILELYNNFRCHVRFGNELSEGFLALQGIHQGAPCSLFMYQIFTNMLLKQLDNSSAALSIYGIKCSNLAYADDLTLISLSPEGLQNLITIAYNYSLKGRFTFNPSKCKVLIFSDKRLKRDFLLGGKAIEKSNS